MADDKARLLLVDDEPRVLAAIQRHLRGQFDITASESGGDGLTALAAKGPFAVVCSDLQMPAMNGIEFLSRVRDQAPDTVRLLLTGNADLSAAIAAVNQGNVFRFLTKPCPPDTLMAALSAAVEQYRLITAEKVLLEQTLMGSIKVLTDVLALVNPVAFSRASRVKQRVAELATAIAPHERWATTVAAMLSQIGCVTLPPELLDKLYLGRKLREDEQVMTARLPELAWSLLGPIPRMEEVRRILRYQDKRFDGTGQPQDSVHGDGLPWGARALKLALDLDILEAQGVRLDDGLATLVSRPGHYDPQLLASLTELLNTRAAERLCEVELGTLLPGMILDQDVRTSSGLLVVGRGQEATPGLIERLRNYRDRVGVNDRVRVRIPPARRQPVEDPGLLVGAAR